MSTRMVLGRVVDQSTGAVTGELVSPQIDQLVTHGVCIGMTGSGKTGVSVALIEELVLAGVPILAIDPKGDLANLALLFPELRGSDFAPWVDDDEARNEGITVDQLGEQTAAAWRKGLGEWDIPVEQLQALRDRMALTIYTPGSTSGVPVDVMGALTRPADAILKDDEACVDLVSGTVTGLLGLVGVDADPVRSPAHLVLSKIIEEAWTSGEDLDIETLLMRVVDPPFKKVGIFPLDRFWKPDDRLDLAMALNGVMASPSFAAWTRGVSLDPERFAAPVGGRVPVSVFHLGHLDDSERMFFVALFLERVVAWSRAQPGTSSLRALVVLDEAFGYMPPHPRNPPSKKPLLTLMKQARAVGIGVLLATQNPVDLDYKALTNAGTWLIGRLSTKQDVDRVAAGLRSAGGAGEGAHRLLSTLRPRQFLLRDLKADAPVVFLSRWAMCFLRGPITRAELPLLAAARMSAPSPDSPPAVPFGAGLDGPSTRPPDAPTGVSSFFLDPSAVFSARLDGAFDRLREPAREDGAALHRAGVYARLALRFDEERHGYIRDEEQHLVWVPGSDGRLPASPTVVPLDRDDIRVEPPSDARFEAVPGCLDEKREWSDAQRQLLDHVLRTEVRGQWVCPPLKLAARDDETRDEFEARCREAVDEEVDQQLDKVRERLEGRIERVEDRLRKKCLRRRIVIAGIGSS